ncbi:ferric-dicitrate binding protein FerR (iron transport regulator) [Dysgonomonas hofstadii]|uniref:Ferric-dicitrate binding protein FerR (Iron transport regulator) n=1 Tax=Dysgonomonas hofstadii TaxID=637886 RepID=A0A840CQP4_9BACT|nr:FecR family protein [Dysgonomonas hofstadii]MBB4037746.1 ferric-dicitrate binding protein FerR (iron transport regulator) [Dysgonomonas hofstadii]
MKLKKISFGLQTSVSDVSTKYMEKELLLRFLKCETTPEEEKLLIDWLDADPENQKELDAMQLMMEGLALCAPEIKEMNASVPSRRTSLLVKLSRVSIAASIAIIIVAGIGYKYFQNTLNGLSSQKTTVEVPDGQRINMTLGDGTEVWLNAGAKLEYPSVFSGEERRVRISGEVMFDVEHDTKHPFIVETFACDIEVLGTKFNIEAYESDNFFSAALMKGSIKLTNRLKKDNPIIMKVNDKVLLVDGYLQLKKIENHDEYLWPEGIISIHNIGFEELMAKFERTYNVQIDIRSKNMPNINYSRGKIRVSDGIDHALRVLQDASNFSYKKDPETGVITIL